MNQSVACSANFSRWFWELGNNRMADMGQDRPDHVGV